ncbi:MAG: O-antigen ligase family protein [Anaerolineae bacterium]
MAANRLLAWEARPTPGVLTGGLIFVALALAIAWAPLPTATAALAVTTIALAVVIAPASGLALIALAIPLGRLVALPLPAMGPVDALVGLTIAAWLLRGMAARYIRWQPVKLTWPLLIFVWMTGLSLTQARSWREGLPEWLKWCEFTALYLVGAQLLDRRWAWTAIAALFLAGLGQVALGLYQFFGQVGPEAFVLMGRYMRAHGTFLQPNPYAGYLGYLTPVAASLAVAAWLRWARARRAILLAQAGLFSALAAALSAGILLSWSRGAWFGLAASLIAVVALRHRRATGLTVAIILLAAASLSLAGTGWLPASLTARLSGVADYLAMPDPGRTEITDDNFAALERMAHWQAGWQMFGDHPWLGVGIGNYAVAYPGYALPHWYEPLGHAHNIFINFLAETGILGGMAFLVLWLGIGRLAWTRAMRTTGYAQAVVCGILGTWVYLTVHSLFDDLFVQHLQLQLALLMAALAMKEDRFGKSRDTLPAATGAELAPAAADHQQAGLRRSP